MKPAIYPLSETSLDIEKDTFFTFWNTTGTLTPGNFFLSFSNSVFRGTPNTPLSNGQEDTNNHTVSVLRDNLYILQYRVLLMGLFQQQNSFRSALIAYPIQSQVNCAYIEPTAVWLFRSHGGQTTPTVSNPTVGCPLKTMTIRGPLGIKLLWGLNGLTQKGTSVGFPMVNPHWAAHVFWGPKRLNCYGLGQQIQIQILFTWVYCEHLLIRQLQRAKLLWVLDDYQNYYA